MKRMRQISDTWTEEDVEFLNKLGIKVKVGLERFNIDEDERYFEIEKHFEKRWSGRSLCNILYHEYSKEDIESAEYYILKGCHSCGYPQPERDFKYESISFDYDRICQECDCGRVQIDNLRVNKLSKHGFWGYSAWLHDEFFVSEKVYNEVFAPYGIEKRPVIKGGKSVEGVFQLVIPVIEESIDLSDRQPETCPVCGETRYSVETNKYPFFPLHKNPLPGIYKTKEYLGSGYQSFRKIVLSKDVVDKLLKLKDLKTIWLIPCRRKDDNNKE